VRIGPIQLSGVSPAMQAGANTLLAGQTGNAFDTENTAIGLQHAFQDFYQDQGYAAVQVAVTQIAPPIISDQAVAIPFAVAIKEGGVYKLGSIDYPADALVPRSEVQKVLSKYQSGSGRPLDLFLLAVRDAYHAHGYLDCSVVSHAAFNEATHIVNYNVAIDPGPVYQMASVHFDSAPDAMTARLTRLWKMVPGQPFDESYVSTFAARAQKQDRTLARWMQTVITSFDVKPDSATHKVDCIFHFAKAAPSAH
jgi:outer membrane protein assembly factor BamA